ncbi:MAG: bifunctional DNA-formamidopyrimidine glycosylase/DNA-(apurinic or apyrimidinic site) lyase [Candidatus Margulisiibacteriota bacterium]|nr:bifunctional DNA-formamidopyrimidine glycosylase/DNA-(apurinic or apyrimidinic site) lyase [Candidatus Margulisiibacteriota bacterium]
MPELPEVEIVRRDVLPFVKGRKVINVEAIDRRVIRGISFKQLKKKMIGQKIVDVKRRAKYLLFELASGKYMVVHLGMTGRLLFSPDDYVKVIFDLSGKRSLYYSDARLFGKIRFFGQYPDLKLGPEPLSDVFTPEVLKGILGSRKTKIKNILMQQRLISGIGNIYAAEALFRARIRPQRRGDSLKDAEIKRLHREIVNILHEALGQRGTSDNWFVDAKGKKGGFQLRLKVYGRKGENCVRCKSKSRVKRIVMAQRGTYFCPRCQK